MMVRVFSSKYSKNIMMYGVPSEKRKIKLLKQKEHNCIVAKITDVQLATSGSLQAMDDKMPSIHAVYIYLHSPIPFLFSSFITSSVSSGSTLCVLALGHYFWRRKEIKARPSLLHQMFFPFPSRRLCSPL